MKRIVDFRTRYPIYNTNFPALITLGWEYEIDNPKVTELKDNWDNEVKRIKAIVGNDFKFCEDGGHDIKRKRKVKSFWKDSGYDYEYDYTLGIEVRSPVGPLFLAKHWATQLIPFTRCRKSHNGPHNNGGIHVNISKNEFTNKQWDKVKNFLHNHKYYKVLYKLSDRSKYSFEENAPQQINYCEHYKYGIITACKSYAYELRMFGAHSDTFLPALEFADALFRYAATVDIITPDGFFSWVDQHKKYQILATYIHQKLNPNASSLHRSSPRNSVNTQAA